MAELEEEYDNPFDANNAPGLALIVQMRLYDVLMAILNKLDSDSADLLYDAHSVGQIISALPSYLPKEEDEEENS